MKTKILVGIFVVLIIIGLVGIFFNVYTDNLCKKECSSINAVAWQKINSGNFSIDDYCVCYLLDEIKLVKLGE